MNRKQRRTADKVAKKSGKGGSPATSIADKVVQKAIEAVRAGAVAEAEAALDEVLARYPDHVEAMHQKGMIMVRGDRIEQGIALLKRVVAAEADQALYWNNLAAAELTAGRAADALPAAQNAVRLDPRYVMARQNLAMAFGDLNRPREQAEALSKLVALAPGDPDHWNQLGLAQINSGDLAAAEQALRRAVAQGGRNAEYLSNLGVLLVQRGRIKEALPHLEGSLELDPDRFTAALHFGVALAAGEDPAKGLRWLRRATSIKPKSDMAWGALADAALLAGEKIEALDAAKRAAMIDPANAVHGQRLSKLQGAPAAQAAPAAAANNLSDRLDQIFIG